jgi:glycosyltransferase involved in cell wall biosynthesis
MRLAYCVRAIFPQHGFGGLERSATGLLRYLLLRGLDVALYTQLLPEGEPFATTDDRRPTTDRTSVSFANETEAARSVNEQNATYGRSSVVGRRSSAGHLAVRTARYGRLPLPPNGIPARLTNYRAFANDMGRKVRLAALRGGVQGIYAHGLCAWGVRDAAAWGVPVVANPHGMEEFKVRDPLKRLAYAPFRAWLRAGYRAADRVIATDHAMLDEVVTLLGVDRDKVVVMPNGIDLDEVQRQVDPQVQRELAERWAIWSGEGLVGISVGRMEANKGFEHLLRALALVQWGREANWRWLFVGEGSLRAHLEEVAGQLGLGEQVVFTGKLSDRELHSLYALCNLFAHPTLYEGSSLVTLEAMAHALPVVASAVGGIPDKVLDGESGFLVEPRDERALAEKIEWMATHPHERAAMGRLGASLVAERFSWTKVAAQIEELFYTLVDEKAACRAQEAPAESC